jgi:hypothetical protein
LPRRCDKSAKRSATKFSDFSREKLIGQGYGEHRGVNSLAELNRLCRSDPYDSYAKAIAINAPLALV